MVSFCVYTWPHGTQSSSCLKGWAFTWPLVSCREKPWVYAWQGITSLKNCGAIVFLRQRLEFGDPPTSETRDVRTAGIAGVCHHTWPWIVRLERTCVSYGGCFCPVVVLEVWAHSDPLTLSGRSQASCSNYKALNTGSEECPLLPTCPHQECYLSEHW